MTPPVRALLWSIGPGFLAACTQPSAVIDVPTEPGTGQGVKATAKPTSAFPSTDVVACVPRVDDRGAVLLGDRDTGFDVDPDLHPRVRAFPWDDETVLIAIGMTSPAWWSAPDQIGTLYRVRCERPTEWTSIVHLDGADFAWAELSSDRRWLYFSHPGVGVLDFAAGDWAPLASPRMIDRCWSTETPIEADDYVLGRIGDDALVVYTGGPCGFEAEWEGRTEVIDGIREGEPTFRRPRAFVGTVVGDARGRLWVGDGGQCSVPESVFSTGHPGMWRSDDAGETWTFVPIANLHGRGVAGVWTHASDPLLIVAQAECCYGAAADFCEGGELLLSEDGGATWTDVSPRLSQSNPAVIGPVDQLEIDPANWLIDVHVASFETELRLRSRNGGRTWQPLADSESIDPTGISRSAELGEWHFEPGLEGLWRNLTREPMDPGRVVLRPVQ